jgi:AcrR family transcriptional regulator
MDRPGYTTKQIGDDMRDVMQKTGVGESDLPFDNPSATLSEPAQQILQAAKTLLLEGGFAALSLDAIVKEAGKNKASVKYYFGNKDGLIVAMLDSLDHDQCLQLAERTRDAVGQERLRRYVDGQTLIASDSDSFLMFFDTFPHVVRDERLRPRLAKIYEWYHEMNLLWLGLTDRVTEENRDDFVALAALLVAVVDGLAMQALLKIDGLDVERSMRLLGRFLDAFLDDHVDSISEPQTARDEVTQTDTAPPTA